MPNCFHLIRKSEPEKGPVRLNQIDQEMCDHFKAPCDPKKWFCYWYDLIGFKLAMGKTFVDIRQECNEEIANQEKEVNKEVWRQWLAITDWLDANFTSDAWYQVGK